MKKYLFSIIVFLFISGCNKKEEAVVFEKTVSVKDKVIGAVTSYCKDNNYSGYESVKFEDVQKVPEGWEVYHTYKINESGKPVIKNAWFIVNGDYTVIKVTNHNPPE